MKKLYFIYILLFVFSCQVNNKKQDDNIERINEDPSMKDVIYYQEKGYQIFEDCGFAIKTPCVLEDVSQYVSGEFFLNYGCITDNDNPSKRTHYQLIVNKLPIGYKDVPEDELKRLISDALEDKIKDYNKRKAIFFGDEEYPGYEVEYTYRGYAQKGVVFSKENFIIGLTVLTNDCLEEKFNKFTNGFKTISKLPSKHKQSNIQVLSEVGYSISAPCELTKSYIDNHDFYYSGAINGENKEKAIVYKVMVDKLPIPYSSMIDYDKKTIKDNLMNYLKSKESYAKEEIGIDNHLAYRAYSREHGFSVKECLILTDHFVIDLMMFSKKDFSSDFDRYVSSFKPVDKDS